MTSSGTEKGKNLEADVVVIGGGGAGLVAAVAAAEKGTKDIMVLEARHELGGNAVYSIGLFAAESPVQKSAGTDSAMDDFFKTAIDFAHWRTNPRLVRALIDKSGDTMRWLEEKGVKIERSGSGSPSQSPMGSAFRMSSEGIGVAIAKAMTRYCQDRGVRLLCQTKAKKLLTSEAGRVVGVLAEAKDGEIRITSKSVIITTG